MKKIIGIIFVSLMFCNIGFAEIKQIEKESIEGDMVETICVDGYKFVAYRTTDGASIVQFYERAGGVSLPAKC